MNTLFTIVAGVIGLTFVMLLICAIYALPVMLLWNYCLVGAVAGVVEIGFWQALGITILCGLLFKSNVSKNKE